MFFWIVGLLIIMFYGDPDIHDKIMEKLDCHNSVSTEIFEQQQLQLKLLNKQLIEFRKSKEPTRKEYTDGY